MTKSQRWDSKSEMIHHVQSFQNHMLLGGESETPYRFVSYTFQFEEKTICLGLMFSQSLSPSLKWLTKSSLVALGYDDRINIIDVNLLKLVNEFQLDGVLCDLISTQSKDIFLAIYETGCLALDGNGQLLWIYTAGDLVEGWVVTKNCLQLTISDQISKENVDIYIGEKIEHIQ